MNQMGGGMGNGMFGGGNPFAGGMPNFGGMGNGLFGNPPAPAPATNPAPAPTPSQPKKGHEALTIKVLPVNTRQSTLYSSSSSVSKIFLKLKQLIVAADSSFLSEENIRILRELEKCLTNRVENPNFLLPSGCFRLIEKLRDLLPATEVFPVMDILRLLVLHPIAAEYFGNIGKQMQTLLVLSY